jgi:hypothetical protein
MEMYSYTNGNFCKSCDGKNFTDCLKCSNCGYNNKCVSGDVHGPYQNNDPSKKCLKWYHRDPFSKLSKCLKDKPFK